MWLIRKKKKGKKKIHLEQFSLSDPQSQMGCISRFEKYICKKNKGSWTHRDIIALHADKWIFNSRGATCICVQQKHKLTACYSALHSTNLLGFFECLLTAQTPRLWRKDEAFLYNPAIMPTMTSADNNQPHNHKYVTHSHRTLRDHYNGLCCLFSSHSLCCLMLKKKSC